MLIAIGAHSSMAEQSAHNALVAGSNPAGPIQPAADVKTDGGFVLLGQKRKGNGRAINQVPAWNMEY